MITIRSMKKYQTSMKNKKVSERNAQGLKMKSFIKNLSQSEDKINTCNERVWMLIIDGAIVHRDSKITIKFQDNLEITNSQSNKNLLEMVGF